jgi:hypothetical protein
LLLFSPSFPMQVQDMTEGNLGLARNLPPHLRDLESESIYILREVAEQFARPVLLYSIGKDSSVLLHLARKAFFTAKPPFPLLHIDRRWKFREMIVFLDETTQRLGLELIVYVHEQGLAQNINLIRGGNGPSCGISSTASSRQARRCFFRYRIGPRSTSGTTSARRIFPWCRREPRLCILWFTGLPAAGKSTILNLVEARLAERGLHTYALDGDNLRCGLNRDLGFTDFDRVENIRRAGEVARLMVDAGLVVLCAFVSPFRAERRRVRELVGRRNSSKSSSTRRGRGRLATVAFIIGVHVVDGCQNIVYLLNREPVISPISITKFHFGPSALK